MKLDYKRVILIGDKENAAQNKAVYRAVVKGDDRGFYKKAVLYAHGDSWTPPFQGQPLVSIEDHDLDMVVRIHKPGKPETVFNLSLSDAADFRALLEVIHRTNRVRYFSPLRILKAVETRILKSFKR